MKTLQLFLVLLVGMSIFNACQKDEGLSTALATKSAPQKMTDLVINSSFDWKTTKKYQFTFTGNVTSFVSISSADGVLYHKALLTAQNNCMITLTLPADETKVHFLYNGNDVEYQLNNSVISYKFI